MGRMLCCERVGLKKGPWKIEEDQKLVAYVVRHGPGKWHSVPAKAGLKRCGKSCRLRWINYLNPDIKRGNFSLKEDQTIIQLHALLGNKWSIIAVHLPGRTDNDIKNYWNTNIKKRLIRMGLDPTTHKPIQSNMFEGYGDGGDDHSKDSILMNHMVQWESVRLEAEAKGSMLQFGSIPLHVPRLMLSKIPTQTFASSDSLTTGHKTVYNMYALALATNHDLHSPVSRLNISSTKLLEVSTSAGQITYPKSSLSYKNDCSVMEGYESNIQDYELLIAVEAFRTARCDSIQELFDGSTATEGLINGSFERDF